LVYFNIKAIQPPQELVEFGAEALTENENEDTNSEVETLGEDIEMMESTLTPQLPSSDEIVKLQLIKRFNADAVRFIHQIHTAIPTLCQLLASTTKSEVIEVIEFFETAQLYKIEKAGEGIKKMLHLIWTKDNNDEGKGIRNRLIESYRKLYIDPDTSISEKDNVNIITRNLIRYKIYIKKN
jgi:condensin complex subunit 1